MKPPISLERSAPKRERRAEAGTRQSDRQADHDARQKMRVDGERREARPWAGDWNTVIQAGHRAHAGRFERGDDAREVVRADAHIAVGEHDDVMTDAWRHVDEVGDLAIQSVHLGFDHEIELARRVRFLQMPDDAMAPSFGSCTPNTT